MIRCRGKLFNEFKLLGCGKNVLVKRTKLIPDDKVKHVNIGVKQGAVTSGILFVLYIDRMIKQGAVTSGMLFVLYIDRMIMQGAVTSGILFVLYIDRMVKMIKSSCKEHGFLKHLHYYY